MDSPKGSYARTGDGVHVAYQTWGSGPVDILISGGLWWHLEFQWTEPTVARYLEGLGRIGRVIAFDKRGTGLSDRVPVDRLPTLEERTDDLTAVLDAVGADKAVVIGQNHGAPMAILFAATYPERTHSLVLQGAFARFVRTADYPWGFSRASCRAHAGAHGGALGRAERAGPGRAEPCRRFSRPGVVDDDAADGGQPRGCGCAVPDVDGNRCA